MSWRCRIFGLAAALCLGLAAPLPLKAQAYIRIDKFSQEKYSLAVPPLYDRSLPPDPLLGQRIEQRLWWCLDFTSLFKRLDRASFIEDQAKSGWTADKIRFSDWAILDALGLIKGWYQSSGNTLEMELNLFDVFQQKKIVGRKYKGGSAALEGMIDAFVNDMLQALTGVKGSFGSKIALVRKVKNRNAKEFNKELFVIDLDGGNLQKITSTNTPTLSPSWSRDGRHIVFIKYPSTNPANPQPPTPYLLDLRGKEVSRIGHFNFMANSPRFSPVSDEIAISLSKEGNEELYLMNNLGVILRRLTVSPGIDVSPSFSPDAKWLAFSSNRSGQNHIYKMPGGGGEAERLTFRGTDNGMPAWSPRGDRIAFAGRDVDGYFDVFTMRPDGNDLTRLTFDSRDNEEPWFSPDGQQIIFTSSRRGRRELWLMRSDGANQRPMTQEGVEGEMPSWGPR